MLSSLFSFPSFACSLVPSVMMNQGKQWQAQLWLVQLQISLFLSSLHPSPPSFPFPLWLPLCLPATAVLSLQNNNSPTVSVCVLFVPDNAVWLPLALLCSKCVCCVWLMACVCDWYRIFCPPVGALGLLFGGETESTSEWNRTRAWTDLPVFLQVD